MMNEGSGNTVNDSSGNGNHAALTGVVWKDNALYYDGVAYGTVLNSPSLTAITDRVTISFWILSDYTSGINRSILAWEGWGYSYGILMLDAVSVRFVLQGTDGDGYITSATDLPRDVWHKVTCVYDGATAKIYINGLEDLSVATTGSITGSTDNLLLGAATTATWHLDGGLDNVLIWSRPLAPAEVASLYIDPYQMFRRDPVYKWYEEPAAGGIVILRRRRESA